MLIFLYVTICLIFDVYITNKSTNFKKVRAFIVFLCNILLLCKVLVEIRDGADTLVELLQAVALVW